MQGETTAKLPPRGPGGADPPSAPVALAVAALLAIGIGVALMTRGSSTRASAPTTAADAPATTAAAAALPDPVPGKGTLVFNGPAKINKVAFTFTTALRCLHRIGARHAREDRDAGDAVPERRVRALLGSA